MGHFTVFLVFTAVEEIEMRKLSELTSQLISELNDISSKVHLFGFGKATTNRKVADLILKVGEKKELGSIEVLASFLFDDSHIVRQASRHAVHLIFSVSEPIELFKMLENSICIYSNAWRSMKPNDVLEMASDSISRVSVLGLLSYHPSGYVRHEAVRLLGEIHDCSELKYLLIRLNDWVKSISQDAQSFVTERITEKYITEIVNCLGIIVRLLECRRYHHDLTVRRIVKLLLAPKHESQLKTVLALPDTAVRRVIFEKGLDFETAVDRIITLGLASTDPAIRLKASKRVAGTVTTPALRQIAHRLQHDTFMPVRREGYLMEAEEFPEELEHIWSRGLLDKNPSIRDYAFFYLTKNKTFDVADFYRKLATESCQSIEVAHGLGLSGDERDLPVIRKLLSLSSSPRMTSALIRSFSIIAKESAIPELLPFLNSNSPSVVRETCHQLKNYVRHVSPEMLFQLIVNNQSAKVRNSLLPLLVAHGKWTSLPWFIRLLNHSDESVVQTASRMITDWFTAPLCNRVFTRPSVIEMEKIQQAINSVSEPKTLSLIHQLDVWLKEASPK